MREIMEEPIDEEPILPKPEQAEARSSLRHEGKDMTPEERLQLIRSRYLGSPEKMDQFAKECAWYVEPIVRGMLRGKSNLQDDFEDVTQAVVAKATLNLKNFHGDSMLKTWIYRIAAHEAMDFLAAQRLGKRDSGETDFLEEMMKSGEELPSQSPTPEEKAIQENRAAALYAAIDELDPHEKMLITLFHLEGHSIKEIQEMVKAKNEPIIRTHLRRARIKLNEQLRSRGFN